MLITAQRETRGLTLVEVMVSMAILSGGLFIVMTSINASNIQMSVANSDAVVHEAVGKFLDKASTELRCASRDADRLEYSLSGVPSTNAGDTIRFQIPIETDDADTVFNHYGATLGATVTADEFIEYRFVPNTVGGAQETLVEAALLMDLNGDLDMADTFLRGSFVRTAPDENGDPKSISISERLFIVGDGDNDGETDPVFFQATSVGGIQIDLIAVIPVRAASVAVSARSTVVVFPRNE